MNIKADVNPCHNKTKTEIVTVSVPQMANAMHIHVVKPALFSKIIQFDEERIHLM